MASEDVLINLNSLAAPLEIPPEIAPPSPPSSSQLNLRGFCFVCLKREETPTTNWTLSSPHSTASESLINTNPKCIKSFQPLLCYLTGKPHSYYYPEGGGGEDSDNEVNINSSDNDGEDDEFRLWLSILRDLPPVCSHCYGKLEELSRLHLELLELQRRMQIVTVEIRKAVKESVNSKEREAFLEAMNHFGMAFEQTEGTCSSLVVKLHDKIISKGDTPVIFPFRPPPPPDENIIEEFLPVNSMTFLNVEIAPDDGGAPGELVQALSPSKKENMQVEFISIDEYADSSTASHIYVTTPMGEEEEVVGDEQIVEIAMDQEEVVTHQNNDQFEQDEVVEEATKLSSSLVETPLPSVIPITAGGEISETDAAVNIAGVPVDPSANYVMITTNVTDPATGVVSLQPILISVAQLQAMQQQHNISALSTDVIIPASATGPGKKSSRKEPVGAYSTPSEYVYFHEEQQPCDVCNARIPRGSEIASHLATHVGSDYVFYCADCRIGFISPFRLEQYHRSKPVRCRLDTSSHSTTGEIYSCSRCSFQTDKLKPFRKHLDQHDSEEGQSKSFQCPLCPLRFSAKQCVELHLGEKHVFTKPSGRQKCDVCGSFFDLGEIEAHLWSHGISELLRCKLCMCIFSSVEAIIEHQTVVKRRGLHDISCHVCESRFIRVKDLRLHYFEEHSLGTKYVCGFCQEEFFTLKMFETHRKKCDAQNQVEQEDDCVESSEEEVVLPSPSSSLPKPKSAQGSTTRKSCPDCGKSLSSSDILLRHRIKEHGHPPLECSRLDCHKTFTSEGERRAHVATDHQGYTLIKKPFSCSQCGETFAKKEKLKSHKFVKHSEAKPYSCDVCGLQYRNKVTLQDHVNFKHLGKERQRNKVCDVCNRAFTDSQVLKHHKLIHTNERPFNCRVCGQRFRQKTALRTHEKSHEQLGDAFRPKGEMERNGGGGGSGGQKKKKE